MMYYSKAGGFLDARIHKIPVGSVPLTMERYRELRKLHAAGKVIRLGEDGIPQAVDADGVSRNPARSAAKAARIALSESDHLVIECYRCGIKYPDAWRDYDAELKKIIADPGYSGVLPKKPPFPEGI